MLETILISLFVGFVGHRLGIMAYDFFSYGEVFGKAKIFFAKKVDHKLTSLFLLSIAKMSKSEAQEKSFEFYDKITHNKGPWAFLLSLMDCKFCTTIWTSFGVALFCYYLYDLDYEILLLTPIFGYLYTEKL